MAEIHGKGNIEPTPREQKAYAKEYQEGVTLFQKALHQAQKADNPFKKEQFRSVMEKAMRVLNQTARALKSDYLQKQNEEIEKDYQAYKGHPGKSELSKLDVELDKAKRSIEF